MKDGRAANSLERVGLGQAKVGCAMGAARQQRHLG